MGIRAETFLTLSDENWERSGAVVALSKANVVNVPVTSDRDISIDGPLWRLEIFG